MKDACRSGDVGLGEPSYRGMIGLREPSYKSVIGLGEPSYFFERLR